MRSDYSRGYVCYSAYMPAKPAKHHDFYNQQSFPAGISGSQNADL